MGLIKRKDIWRKSSLRDWEGECFFRKEIPEEVVVKKEVVEAKILPGKEASEVKTAAETKSILDSARKQADIILSEARRQAEHIKKDAYRKGFEEGRVEGERAVRQEKEAAINEEISRLRLLAERMVSAYNDIVKKAETHLVRLAVKIAEKVIKDESSSRKEIVMNMVREGISRLQDKTSIRVRLNPEDVSFLKDKKDEFLSSFEDIKGFEIVADEAVARGGCVVETPTGSVDLRIDKQLNEIKKNLVVEE